MIKKRLLTVCAVFLLLCVPTQAAPIKAMPLGPEAPEQVPDWERIGYWYMPQPDDLVTEMEFTMRFEPPSDYSGYLETELYTSADCYQCESVTIEFGMFIDRLFHFNHMYICVYEDDGNITWHPLSRYNQIGWWRRHHQFRFEVKHYEGNEFLYKIWDCDTQELLYNDTFETFTDHTGPFSAINPTIEWSNDHYDAYAVWEGHWVRLESGNAHRWDRAPWATQGPFFHDTSEANLMDHGPALHLYDDHPRTCTGGIYWPTGESCPQDGVPLFEADGPVSADPNDLHVLGHRVHPPLLETPSAARDEKLQQPEVWLGPEGPPDPPPVYPKNAFLAHMFNGLEGNAHWNRLDMWWDGYYE